MDKIRTWYVDPAAENAMAGGHAPIWRHLIGLMAERDLAGKAVLDFGCNQGGLLRLLYALRPFGRGLGVDIAEESIARAEALKADLPLQFQAGARLDAWDATFDIALSHEVIYLIRDIDAHAADIRRALKPGGVYYAVTGCHTGNPLWPEWRNLVAERTNTVVQDRSVDDYAAVFAAAGFEVSARRLGFDGFVPYAPGGWFPDFAAALQYYAETKVVFRLIRPR